MKTWIKATICTALSLIFCFMAVGYAAVSDPLNIMGSAKVEIPSGLFITSVTKTSSSNLALDDAEHMQYTTTIDCSLNKSSRYSAGKVTYEVTVLNNTALEYAYRGIYYQTNLSGYNGNSYVNTQNGNNRIGVVCSLASASAANRKVAPGQTLTFTVTYTVGRSMSDVDYNTLINFQFGINVESQEAAIEIVHDKFLDILNTTSTYDTLSDALDNKFDGVQEWTSNYIGNVGSATTDDSMVVNTLFAGQLQMMINGEIRTAHVIIKHENLDNNTMTGDDYVAVNETNGGEFRGYGCEMTLYLTTDDLTNANGYATVYVSVFTCDRNEEGSIVSEWYRIGDTYVGQANVVGYNGEQGGTGSFVTDNWVADAGTYTPTDSYSYTVGQGTTIKQLTQMVDQNAIVAFQNILDRSKKMLDDLTYAGTAITIIEEAYEDASRFYTLDANGNPIANSDTTRAQLCPIMFNLEYALIEAQKAIDDLQNNQQ